MIKIIGEELVGILVKQKKHKIGDYEGNQKCFDDTLEASFSVTMLSLS